MRALRWTQDIRGVLEMAVFTGPAARKVRQARGSALIGLVVAILVFSVLAAAIVPMVGSSGRQVAMADLATQAYLMAESGFRYAASRFLQAGFLDSDRNDALEDIDGNYTLADGKNRFVLRAYAYFYEVLAVTGAGPASVTVKAHAPGTFPAEEISPGGRTLESLKIHIAGRTYTLGANSRAISDEDDNVTMEINAPLATIPKGDMIYPVAEATSAPPGNFGGQNTFNIVCRPGSAQMFPLRNGRIDVDGVYYTYGYKKNDTLFDIRNPQQPNQPLTGITLPASNEIILAPFVRLESTGIYGTGRAQVRRTVTYHTPLILSASQTRQATFSDTFKDKSDWQDVGGNFTSIDDNQKILSVDATVKADQSASADQGSLTVFKPGTAEALTIDFQASRRGTQGFLSYATQLKVGYAQTDNAPPQGYFPDPPIPAFAAAGLSFRLGLGDLPAEDANIFNVNTYGISFLRGADALDDRIPDDLVPLQGERMIVLWQQTDNGNQRQWLAYKETADFFFREDFEAHTNQFLLVSGSGWVLESGGNQRNGSNQNMHFDGNQSGVIGAVVPDSLPVGIDTVLTFWSWYDTVNDLKQVVVRDDVTGELVSTFDNLSGTPGTWHQERFDLSGTAGRNIRIEFACETVDEEQDGFEGWFIDDVRLFYPWPVQEATIAVRLQEAMVVPFVAGTSKIRQGDRVFGTKLGTSGTVLAPPMLTDGNWTDESQAEGTLLLHRVATADADTAFDSANNEQLLVLGATGRAKVASTFVQADHRQANIIRAYYAAAAGSGTRSGSANPLDRDTLPYPRLGADPDLTDLQWPPHLDEDGQWTDDDGNWTSAEDYFRLLEWDAVNDGNLAGLSRIAFTSSDQGLVTNAVIQSRHPDLESPPVFGPGNPEIGLHTFGDGALNVFFDDFGIRLDVSVQDTLPAPVQQ